MKTEAELRQYVRDFWEAHGQLLPEVEHMRSGMVVQNARGTSHLHPWKWGTNGSWIDYWRAFANPQFIAEPPSFCSAFPLNKEGFLKHIAGLNHDDNIVGAHILLYDEAGRQIGIYIVPLCSICNDKFGQTLYIRPGTPMVKMVDPHEE